MSNARPWLANYPSGVPANIDAEAYPTLVKLFEECFRRGVYYPPPVSLS